MVVTEREIVNMTKHGYALTDESILGPYMQKYWNWALRFIPLKAHPNAVTYTGFLWLASAVAIVGYYDFAHTFSGKTVDSYLNGTSDPSQAIQTSTVAAPNFVWFWSALSIFMYQTFDALDGKQARRIKAGSCIGEIVDHSADAVTTIFVQYLQCAALFRDEAMRGFILTALVYAGFFTAHWEHYVTNIFYFGPINGPTEGLLITCVVFLVTAFFGGQFWSDESFYVFPRVEATLPFLPESFRQISIAKNSDLSFYLVVISCLLTIIPSIFKCVAHALKSSFTDVHAASIHQRESPLKSASPTAKRNVVGVNEALARTAVPFFGLCALAATYLYTFSNFHRNNFFLVEVAVGWVAAMAATRVTVARLTGSPYVFWTPTYMSTLFGLVLPLMAAKAMAATQTIAGCDNHITTAVCNSVAVQLQYFADEHTQRLMWIGICAVGCFEYVWYCYKLLTSMAKHLGVNLLVLTPAQRAYVDTMAEELKAVKVK